MGHPVTLTRLGWVVIITLCVIVGSLTSGLDWWDLV